MDGCGVANQKSYLSVLVMSIVLDWSTYISDVKKRSDVSLCYVRNSLVLSLASSNPTCSSKYIVQ